jgi:hypothetical protein
MVWDNKQQDRFISCRDYILSALIDAMQDRSTVKDLSWIETERTAVAVAANQWATSHPPATTVSVDDVERVEQLAVGHYDYASKLALYVAELVCKRLGEAS